MSILDLIALPKWFLKYGYIVCQISLEFQYNRNEECRKVYILIYKLLSKSKSHLSFGCTDFGSLPIHSDTQVNLSQRHLIIADYTIKLSKTSFLHLSNGECSLISIANIHDLNVTKACYTIDPTQHIQLLRREVVFILSQSDQRPKPQNVTRQWPLPKILFS